jgi:hypothetical protein
VRYPSLHSVYETYREYLLLGTFPRFQVSAGF